MRVLSVVIFVLWLLASIGFASSVKADNAFFRENIGNGFQVSCFNHLETKNPNHCSLEATWSTGGRNQFTLNIAVDVTGVATVRTTIIGWHPQENTNYTTVFGFYGRGCRTKWTLPAIGMDGYLAFLIKTPDRKWNQFIGCFRAANGFRLNVQGPSTNISWPVGWSLSGTNIVWDRFKNILDRELTSNTFVPRTAPQNDWKF